MYNGCRPGSRPGTGIRHPGKPFPTADQDIDRGRRWGGIQRPRDGHFPRPIIIPGDIDGGSAGDEPSGRVMAISHTYNTGINPGPATWNRANSRGQYLPDPAP